MLPKIKILIVEGHQLIAEAWGCVLNTVANFEVVSTVDNEKDAIEIALDKRPDIVLMGLNLTEGDGFSCTFEIYNQLPKTKIIGLSIHDDLALVKKLLKKGASGYLTKNCSSDELINAINQVSKGSEYICSEIKNKFFKRVMGNKSLSKELSNREIEIVKLIAAGMTSKVIGVQLHVSNRTIETHRNNILHKLALLNAAQLGIWAKNKGFV